MGRYREGQMTHNLACTQQDWSCTNGHASPALIFVAFGILVVVGVISAAVKNSRQKAGKPPPEPMTDISPAMKLLLTGQNVPSYTAAVNAVTPRGVRVRQRRCCDRGHQSPQQAVAHANSIKQRIETTGR